MNSNLMTQSATTVSRLILCLLVLSHLIEPHRVAAASLEKLEKLGCNQTSTHTPTTQGPSLCIALATDCCPVIGDFTLSLDPNRVCDHLDMTARMGPANGSTRACRTHHPQPDCCVAGSGPGKVEQKALAVGTPWTCCLCVNRPVADAFSIQVLCPSNNASHGSPTITVIVDKVPGGGQLAREVLRKQSRVRRMGGWFIFTKVPAERESRACGDGGEPSASKSFIFVKDTEERRKELIFKSVRNVLLPDYSGRRRRGQRLERDINVNRLNLRLPPAARPDTARGSSLCGDGLLNQDSESCDPGTPKGDDPCCSERCQLRPLAECAPAHHPCCTEDCKVALPTKRCRSSVTQYSSCVSSVTFCDGVDPTVCGSAPTSAAGGGRDVPPRSINQAPDFSPCGSSHACRAGQCLPLCSARASISPDRQRLTVCVCVPHAVMLGRARRQQDAAVCSRCCAGNATVEPACAAMTGRHLTTGRPCVYGLCVKRGCFRFERAPNYFRDGHRKDRESVSSGKGAPRHDGVPYLETWHSVFRWTYWLLSLGMVVVLVYVSATTVYSVLQEEETTCAPRPHTPERKPVLTSTAYVVAPPMQSHSQ